MMDGSRAIHIARWRFGGDFLLPDRLYGVIVWSGGPGRGRNDATAVNKPGSLAGGRLGLVGLSTGKIGEASRSSRPVRSPPPPPSPDRSSSTILRLLQDPRPSPSSARSSRTRTLGRRPRPPSAAKGKDYTGVPLIDSTGRDPQLRRATLRSRPSGRKPTTGVRSSNHH
jgi:hypothetical protein